MKFSEIIGEAHPKQVLSIYNPNGRNYRGSANRMPRLTPDPVDDASPISAADNVPDEDDPSKIYDRKEMQRAVTQALSRLSPKEEQVLRMRFFLDMTLQEIADKYRLSTSRIRDIEASGLRKLKHPVTARKLKGFMNPSESYWSDEQILETSQLFQTLALRHTMLSEGRLDEAGIWDVVKGTVGVTMKGIKTANDAVDKLGELVQNTNPVLEFDFKVDEIVADIKRKLGNRSPKAVETAEKYAAWGKKHPVKQGLIIGALTAVAALSGGAAAAAAAAFILRATSEYMKGERASTAFGKAAKTSLVAGLLGAITHWGFDQIGDALTTSLPDRPVPYSIKQLYTMTFSGTLGNGTYIGPQDAIEQISALRSQAMDNIFDNPSKAADLLAKSQQLAEKLPEMSKSIIAANTAGTEAYEKAYQAYREVMDQTFNSNRAIWATVDRIKELASAGVTGAAASGVAGKVVDKVKGAAGAVADKYRQFVPSSTYQQVNQQVARLAPDDRQKLIDYLQQKVNEPAIA